MGLAVTNEWELVIDFLSASGVLLIDAQRMAAGLCLTLILLAEPMRKHMQVGQYLSWWGFSPSSSLQKLF